MQKLRVSIHETMPRGKPEKDKILALILYLSGLSMNAELIADDEQRIIIPTVYRENYLLALKGLSHNKTTDAFVKMIDFAQKYTLSIDWTS
ncbi:MAG: hypothetical protein K5780_02265 [Alphaproteobacteria bacterium]|nr:hypothetical protein [Alphaproteobacteria bacterium]